MSTSPMQYLDKAMDKVRDLGLLPDPGSGRTDPMVALLNQLTGIDEERVIAISRTLSQASFFNDVVREQVQAMDISDRYEDITNAFNSIRDDAKNMVDQLDDGKISTFERISNMWMKATRGDIADRFATIKDTYLDVTDATQDQIQREQAILDAYQDFRGALKAEGLLKEAQAEVQEAMHAVEAFQGDDMAERARLEMARDEAVRALQTTEKKLEKRFAPFLRIIENQA